MHIPDCVDVQLLEQEGAECQSRVMECTCVNVGAGGQRRVEVCSWIAQGAYMWNCWSRGSEQSKEVLMNSPECVDV
jgi:hypothetical protein